MQFRFDYRLGDVNYVYADPKFHKSGEAFSGVLNALEESDSLAIVRYVGKSFTRNDQQRWPDPKMCALWPVIGADELEYAYMIQVSFLIGFPAFSKWVLISPCASAASVRRRRAGPDIPFTHPPRQPQGQSCHRAPHHPYHRPGKRNGRLCRRDEPRRSQLDRG